MSFIPMMCRVPTTFSKSGGIDEEAQRQYNQRIIDSRIGLYLGSGGTAEGHTLSFDELRQGYKVGVASARGKVPVWANSPEQHTARGTIAHARLAIECGVEGVTIYALSSLHLMKPTKYELAAYYDEVLGAIEHPVALSPNPTAGFVVPAETIAGLVRKYPQVSAINLSGGINDSYFIALKNMLDREVDIFVGISGSEHMLNLGARGLVDSASNILPRTYRRYLDMHAAGNWVEMSRAYQEIEFLNQYSTKWWGGGQTRYIKMIMKVLKLPGGEGGVREPYRMPPQEELAKFAEGLVALPIPELKEMARAAGYKV